MTVEWQDVLICMNPQCRAEFVVVKKTTLRGANPRCFCGSEMKHAYHSPVLRVLDERERTEVEGMSASRQHFSPTKNI